MEEKPNPTSQEATRSVLGPVMWMDCLRLVIAPRIARTVQEVPDIENRQQLHRAFCEMHEVRPSYSTFSGWCEDLGINFKKRIEVSIPGWRDMPAPPTSRRPVPTMVQQEEEPVDPDTPVQWDAPTSRDIPLEAFNDNMPTILPGGFRAPTFIGDNNFGN